MAELSVKSSVDIGNIFKIEDKFLGVEDYMRVAHVERYLVNGEIGLKCCFEDTE